jgi:hypothetical protein
LTGTPLGINVPAKRVSLDVQRGISVERGPLIRRV